ncbi:cell wall-associated NlpC family hydrolase [Scopulibacillus daqui]|uniref:Cell wall-associated NlpC family hydrolase n=1 Tax=Scopulibacillus daqui TaxID=1469162 RepID=A0ABS2Q432_9BACL|nr:C40 family peptidase [Scopulibacillus daqui]MBM7647045.1 cell wall-associated NlpC family hydrolase [Scopulibacillus daqui]
MSITLRKPKLFVVLLSLILATSVALASFGHSASAAEPSTGDKIAKFAKSLEGKPYKYGGNTPEGFDASGFTQYVFKNDAKVTLPRTIADQYKQGTTVSQKDLKAGDLVFFQEGNSKSPTFVGIYMGDQKFIAATLKGVKVQSLTANYWKNAYMTSKRIVK